MGSGASSMSVIFGSLLVIAAVFLLLLPVGFLFWRSRRRTNRPTRVSATRVIAPSGAARPSARLRNITPRDSGRQFTPLTASATVLEIGLLAQTAGSDVQALVADTQGVSIQSESLAQADATAHQHDVEAYAELQQDELKQTPGVHILTNTPAPVKQDNQNRITTDER